jgi:hypothetical protein
VAEVLVCDRPGRAADAALWPPNSRPTRLHQQRCLTRGAAHATAGVGQTPGHSSGRPSRSIPSDPRQQFRTPKSDGAGIWQTKRGSEGRTTETAVLFGVDIALGRRCPPLCGLRAAPTRFPRCDPTNCSWSRRLTIACATHRPRRRLRTARTCTPRRGPTVGAVPGWRTLWRCRTDLDNCGRPDARESRPHSNAQALTCCQSTSRGTSLSGDDTQRRRSNSTGRCMRI